MIKRGIQASISTYGRLLQACIRKKALAEGKRIHAHIIKSGLESDIFLGNTLVDMYGKCGNVSHARELFDKMPAHNVFSWTVIISAYAKRGLGEEAVNLFQQMQERGVAPDKVTFVVVLRAFASLAALEQGRQVHALIIKSGFESDVYIGSTLVDMYAKCGSAEDARRVFNKMSVRNVVSWNAMIAGYGQQGQDEEALTLFEQMKHEGVKPNNMTFASVLKACSNLADLGRGMQVHALAIKSGFELDTFVGNTLVDMYAKCGSIEDARKMFNRMHDQDVVSWTALIAGYSHQGYGEETLILFEQMQKEGVIPNKVTFVSVLKACARLAALEQGKRLHALIIKNGFESDVFVGNMLVDMYSKCGSLVDAHQVFIKIQKRDVVSWTVLIAGYAQQRRVEEALALLEQMQQEGVKPNNITFASILKACASLASLEYGKQVHDYVIKSRFDSDVVVRRMLIDMYVKCGSIEDAHQVFEETHGRNVVLWNVLIAGYAQQGCGDEALTLFDQMQQEGVKPNNGTFVSILKACARLAALEQGKQVHAYVIQSGLESDIIVGSSIVDMYVKCGSIKHARQVFDKMQNQDVISWNVMIAGYAEHGLGEEALVLFEQMQRAGVVPDKVIFVSVLKACGSLTALERGKQVHAHIIKSEVESDVFVWNTLVDMYAKCGSIDDARRVFNKMHERDVVTWNVMIAAYAQGGYSEEALNLFEQMQLEGVKASSVTFVSVLKACVGLASLEKGKQVHALVIGSGLELDVFVRSALVDMYAKCGNIEDARKVFNKMHERDVVSWTAMIAGYAQHGHGEEALKLVEQMQWEGVEPNSVTFVSILQACANLAALDRGKKVHDYIIQSGLESDAFVASTLIDMYAKCGSIEDARQVFNKMREKDVVLWTAIIAGYAQQGHGEEALILFERMQREGVKPNTVTIVCVLSACSHAGLVDRGRHYFTSLSQDHGITPTMEHYACMVDLLGRAGHLDEAGDFINKLPIEPEAVVWLALLGACRSHGNVDLGRCAFEHVQKLEPRCSGAYVLLSNIYATAGRWEDVRKIRKQMEDVGGKTTFFS